MADNKDTEELFDGIGDLGDFADLGELETLTDEDFDGLMGEDLSFDSSDIGHFATEFDGLMDLSDFEELNSSDNMAGLEGLLEIDSNNWEDTDPSVLSEEKPLGETADQDATRMVKESEKIEESAVLLSEGETKQDKDDIDALLNEIPYADEHSSEGNTDINAMGDIPNMGGTSLGQNSDISEIGDMNEELLLDVPELDEKQEKKVLKRKNKKGAGSDLGEKVSIWKKLFGNVPDENAEKNAAKEAERQAAREAKKASKKTKEEIALEKQEKQKAKEEAASVKKAEKDAKQAKKEEKKKLKQAEKAAAKEARELEEAQEPVTRINRVGAGIIFVTFAVIAVVIIVGNNSYAYSQCIAKASAYFTQKEYTNAYNQIYGLEVKESDVELRDQVMTVMFVEKQLNSFDNYFAMEMYPEALDSLLKGLDKYDKYLEQARSLGIEGDITYVKDGILSELKSAFNISEKKAYKLLEISNTKEYTEAVVKASGGK